MWLKSNGAEVDSKPVSVGSNASLRSVGDDVVDIPVGGGGIPRREILTVTESEENYGYCEADIDDYISKLTVRYSPS